MHTIRRQLVRATILASSVVVFVVNDNVKSPIF